MNTEIIVASYNIGVEVAVILCQRALNGIKNLDKWKTSVVVPFSKGKEDVVNWGSYRGIKLLEHAINTVTKVLEK